MDPRVSTESLEPKNLRLGCNHASKAAVAIDRGI